MRLIWLLGGGVVVGGLLAAMSNDAQAAGVTPEVFPPIKGYPEHPAGPWGPIWRDKRPHGLPATARRCSDRGAALPYIRRMAASEGPEFTKLVEGLADTESKGMFGCPAIKFDIRPKPERGGAPLITAWGCFQWNRDAIANAGHMASLGIPGFSSKVAGAWEWSPDEELALPLAMYRQIWQWARARRATPLDAARAVRLWQQTSKGGKTYLERGAATHWQAAWALADAGRRAIVDRHLAAAGLV